MVQRRLRLDDPFALARGLEPARAVHRRQRRLKPDHHRLERRRTELGDRAQHRVVRCRLAHRPVPAEPWRDTARRRPTDGGTPTPRQRATRRSRARSRARDQRNRLPTGERPDGRATAQIPSRRDICKLEGGVPGQPGPVRAIRKPHLPYTGDSRSEAMGRWTDQNSRHCGVTERTVPIT